MRRLSLLILLALLAAVFRHPSSGYAKTSPTATPSSVIAPIVTATPRTDGSLVHVVGFGQTLAEIASAYGVTAGEIQRLNGLPPDSTTLYSGQKLLILPRGGPGAMPSQPPTATPAPTLAPTQPPATDVPAPTLVAPAASPSDNDLILPLAGALILLGGFLLLAAALVIKRKQ